MTMTATTTKTTTTKTTTTRAFSESTIPSPTKSSSNMIRHRSYQQRHHLDDADAAAGAIHVELHHTSNHSNNTDKPNNSPTSTISKSNSEIVNTSASSMSMNMNMSSKQHHNEMAKDHQQQQQVQVLGIDISHLSRKCQFLTCATGVFAFSLLYGYLQELISVTLCNRQLGLFIAMSQFMGYSIWSKVFHVYVKNKKDKKSHLLSSETEGLLPITNSISSDAASSSSSAKNKVPMKLYIIISILRAIDAGMTNMAMAYVNYPAKTLLKSSRVVFTMIFGTLMKRKKYSVIDYMIVLLMVSGLAIFLHADAQSSAVFQPIGIIMLVVSLLCDGAVSNMSEAIMNQYNIGQDEFIYNLYTIVAFGITCAALVKGDLKEGFLFLFSPGTYDEIQDGITSSATATLSTWSAGSKILMIVLFSSTGFFGSSCSALITKEFGALTMSITSTARKATTLFLSFALFNHVCTFEHVSGIGLFLTSLVVKSFRASKKGNGSSMTKGTGTDHKGHYADSPSTKRNKMNLSSSSSSGKGLSIEASSSSEGTSSRMEGRVKRRLRRKREQVVVDIV